MFIPPLVLSNALLVCAEPQTLKVLETVLDELEISHDACHTRADAMEQAVRGQYSAVVLDFGLEGCAQVGQPARMAAPQAHSVLFALVGASTPGNRLLPYPTRPDRRRKVPRLSH